jgi:hypothetical protein
VLQSACFAKSCEVLQSVFVIEGCEVAIKSLANFVKLQKFCKFSLNGAAAQINYRRAT